MTVSDSAVNANQVVEEAKATCSVTTHPLTPEFWDSFAEHHWEKEELVLNERNVPLPISEQALFDIVVGMSERKFEKLNRSDKDSGGVRVYIGGNRDPFGNEIKDLPLFPRKEDKTFIEYSKRVGSILNGQEFSLVIDGLEMSDELRDWTYDLLKGMYRPLKKLAYGHFWSIFFGNYTTTTYGVHDHVYPFMSESALYFPITGNKQMRTWRPDYVECSPELKQSHDYSDHTDASVLLSSDPGGIMYWPSDRWHIGSSSGGDVSIVLAIVARRDVLDTFFESDVIISELPRSRMFRKLASIGANIYSHCYLPIIKYTKKAKVDSLPFDPNDLQGSASAIPSELRKIVRPFSFIFGKNTERVMSYFWLHQLSTYGCDEGAIHPSEIGTFPGTRLERNIGVRMLWRQVDVNTYIVVSGKSHTDVPTQFLPLVEYIGALPSGSELVYADMVRHVTHIAPTELTDEVDTFISFLNEARVIKPLDSIR